MVEVGTVANYAEIIGAILVVGGLGFAVLELRRAREQKKRDGAYQIFNNLGSREFTAAQQILRVMPAGLSRQELEDQYGDKMADIGWVLTQFENLGTMVYSHVVPLDLTYDFYQPSILNTARKLDNYIQELREMTGNDMLYFYFEWMAGRIEEMSTNLDIDEMKRQAAKWRPA